MELELGLRNGPQWVGNMSREVALVTGGFGRHGDRRNLLLRGFILWWFPNTSYQVSL
jgi:hypothetical protein